MTLPWLNPRALGAGASKLVSAWRYPCARCSALCGARRNPFSWAPNLNASCGPNVNARCVFGFSFFSFGMLQGQLISEATEDFVKRCDVRLDVLGGRGLGLVGGLFLLVESCGLDDGPPSPSPSAGRYYRLDYYIMDNYFINYKFDARVLVISPLSNWANSKNTTTRASHAPSSFGQWTRDRLFLEEEQRCVTGLVLPRVVHVCPKE